MERERCEYLEWELNVVTLREFKDIIRKGFDPTHTLPLTKKLTPPPIAHPLQRYPSPPKVHPKIPRRRT